MKDKLKRFGRAYLAFARKAGTVQAKIIFYILYFLFFPLLILFVKRKRKEKRSNWVVKEKSSFTLEDLKKEY
ncbi:MAG TPA: hypothetical protein ENG13_05605 [bacterium]|nr:hypothetical protein [bacterium]HEX68517.1 hypothetical protein [bacterium]